ncbi:zinc transporter ZIP10-like isoform X2 [Scleropages formosus]|uniref:zinc transporter ZIP10-like isoform X2 n=1 Tax=Scleropages formosus TaxID=113540 RepID=UPI0010FAA78A|nr:zinc transporter ZIP10-like isoform X2 [Scleropages formosus]
MKVHMHTRFCLLCGVVFLFPQDNHCHEQGHLGHGGHTYEHSDTQQSEVPDPSISPVPPDQDLTLSKQRFYIQQLFRRYGQQDRLDFSGFQSLLLSLGLGQVRVVGRDHEHVDRGLVAHVGKPEVREHHNSHSSFHSVEQQQQQPHSSSKPELLREQERSLDTAEGSAGCIHRTTGLRKASNSSAQEDHKRSESHRRKLHPHNHKRHPKHQHVQHKGNSTLIRGFPQEQSYVTGESHHPQVTQPLDSRTTRPKKPSKSKGLSDKSRIRATAPPGLPVFAAVLRGTDGTGKFPPPNSHIHTRPFTTEHREPQHGVEGIQNHSGQETDRKYNSDTSQSDIHLHLRKREAPGTLTDHLSTALVSRSHRVAHQHEASQGEHDHSHFDSKKGEVDLISTFPAVWKGLTALAGIYLLFIIEHCISMFKHYKNTRGTACRKRRKGEEAKIGRKLSDHKLNRRSDAEWLHLKPLTEDSVSVLAAKGAENFVLSCSNEHDDTQLTELQDSDNCSQHQGDQSLVKENGRNAKARKHSHSHGHSHHTHCHSDQDMKDAGIASIAWMVIMGDGMHNFSDGLAIGAAFSANVTGGISTSVAVFCHELPHELGDFAVLLKAGMSVKQAIIYNVLSALMAYVGVLIGTTVGQYTHNVTSWIFAVTAGMFLYVALVDMLPEMLHGDSEEHKRCQLSHFLLQNVGMLSGFTIMLLIALFEDHIVLDFGI